MKMNRMSSGNKGVLTGAPLIKILRYILSIIRRYPSHPPYYVSGGCEGYHSTRLSRSGSLLEVV